MYTENILKNYCKNLVFTHKSMAFSSKIKKDGMQSRIESATAFLNDGRLSARVFCLLNNISEHPLCLCGNLVKFDQYSTGFHRFCSSKCSANSKETREISAKTNVERYGHKNAFHCDQAREGWEEFNDDVDRKQKSSIKRIETLKSNYGVKTSTEAFDILMEKTHSTKLLKYGSIGFNNREKANPNRNELSMIAAFKKTSMETYGTEHPMQHPDVFDRFIQKNHNRKEYVLPSGKKVLVQGYENFALDLLLQHYDESDIVVDRKNIPIIKYIREDGSHHTYYPDIFIPSKNLIIEVKSNYTIVANFAVNLVKQKACTDAGFLFEFMIFDKNRELHSLESLNLSKD